jgi:hypothetical protein
MKKPILVMAAIFVLATALSLHPLLANNSQKSSHWDNVTDNRTMGHTLVIGGGQVDIANTSSDNGAHFGMGVVANLRSRGHFTYMSDNLNINCKPQNVFDAICGERASFECVETGNQSSGVYIIEAFAADNDNDSRGFISIFPDNASYNSITAVEEGFVTHGVIKVECPGRDRVRPGS